MIPLRDDEVGVLKRILTLQGPLVNYNEDNEVKIEDPDSLNKYTSKFDYVPYAAHEPPAMISKMKDRGVSEYIRDPYYIQEQLNKAKRNDRFKQFPGVVIGIDSNNKLYFYKKGEGNNFRDITLSSFIRLPTRSTIETDTGNSYHVYCPFNRIGKNGIYDKNYSLKVLGWLVEDAKHFEFLIPYFIFMVKGTLISSNVVPDYIVTIKSSKPVNEELTKAFKKDPYFSKTKVITIKKPSVSEVIDEYKKVDYPDSDFFKSISPESELKMKNLSGEDRKIYASICQNIYKDHSDIKDVVDKTMIFIDDIVTTGSTLSKILIPLYESRNKLIPFSFLMR